MPPGEVSVAIAEGHHSALLSVMADGIGNLCFASEDWTDVLAERLGGLAARHADGLADVDGFTLCEVAHNPPAHLRAGASLAWYLRFKQAAVEVATGELPADACDLKIEGDHSIMSNMGRIRLQGRNPCLVVAAQRRLNKLSRWKMHGAFPKHEVLSVVLRSLHDEMAALTMPRFVFMTPEWVSTARHILTERAAKLASTLRDCVYTFAEEFTDTPAYAFPDGSPGGFWVRCERGLITVGAGPLPEKLGPADGYTKGPYALALPVGRTVDATMTDAEKADRTEYSKEAFQANADGELPVTQSSPSGKGAMPPSLMRVFAPLHDELSKRTSGDLPVDYDDAFADFGPRAFDRQDGYDKTWLRYDEFDIYGNPRKNAEA